MISAKLIGGLGNQLFQIATTYVHALNHNDTCAFNLNVACAYQGNNPIAYKNNVYSKLAELPNGWKPQFIFKEQEEFSKLPYRPDMMLEGYLSGERYIGDRRNDVVELFSNQPILDMLRRRHECYLDNSVSMHVRRGDYLKFSNVYILLGWDYYQKALNIIQEKAKVEHVLIFSDDIEWCREHIPIKNAIFIGGQKDYEDMYLMSLCSHNILANSSFSWWGSYLNINPDKIVVAPEIWFQVEGEVAGRPDNAEPLFCTNWIKI